tara:strand:- start:3895 stop:7410 length:3516 start_codon:yes stop_codon:yes gene_type:complete
MDTTDTSRKNIPAVTDKKKDFENIVKLYLENNSLRQNNNKTNELEIRFGTNPKISTPISKINYDNVIKYLYSNGFQIENKEGIQMLRIQNEYTDIRSGLTKISNTRAEINGSDLIQEYCRSNNIQKVIDQPNTIFNKLKFTQKMPAEINGERLKKVDFEDFNFRVSYQVEQDFNVHHNFSRSIISKWENSLKIFRCMNRIRFYHDDYPIFADLSIVKTSKKTNKVFIPKYTIQEADVFNNLEHYEIELEIDNNRIGTGTKYDTLPKLMVAIRKCIRIVLSGLQGSNYPISYQIQNDLIQSYMKLIHTENFQSRRIYPKDFIGPSSYTLQIENIVKNNENTNIPNICYDYTVTDKADGIRCLLYVANDGKIYLIDTNMKIIFTGVETHNKDYFNSVLDGEYITKNKVGNNIHLFMAFDIYYVNEQSTREHMFYPKDEDAENKYRLKILYQFINELKPVSILDNKSNAEVKRVECKNIHNFQIKCKMFYHISKYTDENGNIVDKDIFSACNEILSKTKDDTYEYNTDGLIFTPAYTAVGANKEGDPAGPLNKYTWPLSFKWKPAEFNTIDFLVTVKKDSSDKEEVRHIFQDGSNLNEVHSIIQYKTLILRCGFDEKKHGIINPCQAIVEDTEIKQSNMDNENNYKPVPFQPTEPSDPTAYLCNIKLQEHGTQLYMMTEENEYFEENTIVEFKYVMDNEEGWKWVPLRVRYDKTNELRAGLKNYGNAYHVANNNWYSIHNPITNEMISTGLNIPETYNNDEVYYNRSNDDTNTKSLREFHNLYVKSKLITGVSNRGDTLIDYAVGKAGDLAKWLHNNLDFVLGVDVSKDNIHNQLDGACTRYLQTKKKYNNIPRALFVVGDSSLNIRNGSAFNSTKEKQIIDAVFGSGPKDISLLGKGVYKEYGIANTGFNISSCQFALHYFFENKTTLLSFIKNIAECTKINGYFIGTCYDGKKIFNELNTLNNGESISINKNDNKIYELTKLYDQTGFPDDELSLGYPINVYQESINKTFREYLVNFNYFMKIMEDYGFVLISKEEANQISLPDGSGLFNELYTYMEEELKMDSKKKHMYKSAIYMSPEEKRISFMNRYFVFKKVRNVDTKLINNIHLKDNLGDERVPEDKKEDDKTDEKEKEEKNKKNIPKKTNKKLLLKQFTPPDDSDIKYSEKMVRIKD